MEFYVSINRGSDDKVRITFKDVASNIEFAEAVMDVEEYGMVITGRSEVSAIGKVKGLQYVGKQKVTEPRSVVCPLKCYDKFLLQEWLMGNCQEDGWIINTYLGSQRSTETVDGGTKLNYRVFKYVDVE